MLELLKRYLPTKRTARKFGRDMLVAVGAFAVAYFTENASSLELGAEETGFLVVVVGLGWRTVRGWLGQEPGV